MKAVLPLFLVVSASALAGPSVDWSKPHPIKGLPGYFVERVPRRNPSPITRWDYIVVDSKGRNVQGRDAQPRHYGLNVWVNMDTGVCGGKRQGTQMTLKMTVAHRSY